MLTLILGVTCFFFLWSANPVHGVLSLVVVGLALAGTLLGQGLEFPALLIVLVYVGAVTVLFIFVVMMVNLRATPVSYLTAEAPGVWLLLGAILVASTGGAYTVAPGVTWGLPHLEGYLNLETLGFHLYGTERVYFVFVVGLVLFVAMVAAICLSLVGGENYRTQEFYSQIRRSNSVYNLVSQSTK
jgi:NADH-quinone oxidoreductase subunit J